MPEKLRVIISRGQSRNPEKRGLEDQIAHGLLNDPRFDVTLIANAYDLQPDGPAITELRAIEGDFVFLSWLYPRAAHWLLDRNGIRGQVGPTELATPEDQVDEDDEDWEDLADEQAPSRVVEALDLPDRQIYSLDLRASAAAADYVNEVQRIFQHRHAPATHAGLGAWLHGEGGTAAQHARYAAPTNDTGLALPGGAREVEEQAGRRWYPVIDFSRCTNCMECIDFCLFGVYGVDGQETILVEQPDNCRKGCPACSRVCPENAIVFPQHKTPAIAGAAGAVSGLKIDLSQLFGAPDADAAEVAARERDEQLMLAGRAPVGMEPMPKRQLESAPKPKDSLDELIDELDDLDL